MRTHAEERPYECSKCDYSAKQIRNLHSHLKTHTGERPFKCDRCDYAAARKETLQKHLKTHTKERPNRCHTGSERSITNAMNAIMRL